MDNTFSQEQAKQIIAMYQNGVDIDTIVSSFDSDEHMIREVLKYNRIDRGYRIWSDELESRVMNFYKNRTIPVKEIMYRCLVAETGIIKVAKRNHIEVPKRQIYKRNSNYFDSIDTQNKAYVLGLFYADGCNVPYRKTIAISLQEGDRDILDAIKIDMEYDGPLRYVDLKNPKHKNHYMLYIGDKHLSEQLEKLGAGRAKSNTITFPDFIEKDLIPHFIRGVYDGDGSISWNKIKKSWVVDIVGTLEMCEGISSYMHEQGIKSTIHKVKDSPNCYSISPTSILGRIRFLNAIYDNATLKMKRKYEKYLLFCEECRMRTLID